MKDERERASRFVEGGGPGDETSTDAAFRKLRSDVRILFWMTSASLVMAIIILIAVSAIRIGT